MSDTAHVAPVRQAGFIYPSLHRSTLEWESAAGGGALGRACQVWRQDAESASAMAQVPSHGTTGWCMFWGGSLNSLKIKRNLKSFGNDRGRNLVWRNSILAPPRFPTAHLRHRFNSLKVAGQSITDIDCILKNEHRKTHKAV